MANPGNPSSGSEREWPPEAFSLPPFEGDINEDPMEQTLVDFPLDRMGGAYTFEDMVKNQSQEDYSGNQDMEERALQPTLWIVNDRAVSSLSYSPEQVTVAVGNSQEASDVFINDPGISKKQLVITRIGNEWMFVDRGAKDLCRFDGILTRQIIAPWNCRCVVQMGNSYLVFTGTDLGNFQDPRQIAPKRRRLDVIYDPPGTEAQVFLSNSAMTASSIQSPILLGSHMLCDIIIAERTVRPFHAMLYWGLDGIYVEPLGNFKIQVNEETISEPFRVNNDDVLTIGSDQLKIEIFGDHVRRCYELFADGLEFQSFCLTPLGGVADQAFTIPSYGGAITIGRSASCGITLNDKGVSRTHAQIIPAGKSFHLIDNYSANGTFVNNEKISKARVHAGDVIEIGKTFFVVHYTE